jgi:hypothetical protein
MEIFYSDNKSKNEYYRFNRINWFSSIDYLIKDKLNCELPTSNPHLLYFMKGAF